MANSIDPNSGCCAQTRTFHSLRLDFPLPPPSQPLSITDYALSLIPPTASSTTVLIDSATDRHVSYSLFLQQSKNLAFATSSTVHKIPKLQYGTVIIDSPEFLSMINGTHRSGNADNRGVRRVQMSQSDPAAIFFSSGTTRRVKGVLLTHRNLIALIGGYCHLRNQVDSVENEPDTVCLITPPLFHMMGFFMLIRLISMGETLVLMQRFDFEGMLKVVERYKITYLPVSPPLIVALAKSELVNEYTTLVR